MRTVSPAVRAEVSRIVERLGVIVHREAQELDVPGVNESGELASPAVADKIHGLRPSSRPVSDCALEGRYAHEQRYEAKSGSSTHL
jgi:hypothetical protein